MCACVSGFISSSPVHYSYRYRICANPDLCFSSGVSVSSAAPLSPPARFLRGQETADAAAAAAAARGSALFAGQGDTELLDKVRAVVSEQLGVDINKVQPSSHFVKVIIITIACMHACNCMQL